MKILFTSKKIYFRHDIFKLNKIMYGTDRLTWIRLARLSFVIGTTLFLHSCIKDELTQPVKISLSAVISDIYKSDDTLSFESGEIVLNEIRFDGKREAGGDYSFYTEPGKKFGPLLFYPKSGIQSTIASFDIPQGIYTMMRWRFELSGGLKRAYDDDGEVDPEAETPGLILNGSYISREGKTLNIRIEIDSFELFECLSFTETGSNQIDIISGDTYDAIFYIDPYYVFRAISTETLEDADYEDDGTPAVLLISSDSNEELYEMILFRLQQSVKIVVS
jgi:hypothetical protein